MSDDKELPLRLKAYTDLKVENARQQRQINALKSVNKRIKKRIE